MKIGDLVTLSSYACGLNQLARWTPSGRRYCAGHWAEDGTFKAETPKPMVGIVTHKATGDSYYNRDKTMFHVTWFIDEDPPVGRDGRWGSSGFYRKDLKFVSKIKK